MSDSSEEKNLPPSQQKLRKAREKGQVVSAPEAIASVTTIAVLIYLYARREAIWADLVLLFSITPDPALPFMAQLEDATAVAIRLGLMLAVPIVAGVIALTILAGMAVSGGPMLSFHPLVPTFDKLNPTSGVKKILGRSALMRFLMHVIRATAILTVLGLMLSRQIAVLVPTPPCGLGCVGQTAVAMTLPLLVATIAILSLAALFDYLVQRANFMREQKMSITEYKREAKEQEGDPQMRGQMRQEQRAMVDRPTGLSQATVILTDGRRRAIGLRYVPDETPAPLVVIRANGSAAVARLAAAANVPVHDDPMATELIATVPVGGWVDKDDQVNAVVPYLT